MNILRALEKRSKSFIFVLAGVQIFALAVINFLTGYEYSFSIFFLIPVAMVAWYGGKVSGITVAVVSAIVWQFTNYQAGQTFSSAFVPVWNAGTRLGFFLIVVTLLLELKRSFLHERTLARTDFLTGAENPRSFYEKAKNELMRSRRYNRQLSIAYLDADNFKEVNDTLGHQVGSDLLVKLVEGIKGSLRATDIVARIGGDEFTILLPETSSEQARIVVSKIRANIDVLMKEQNWNVTFSIGVLTCDLIPDSVDDLIKAADGLMYDVKKTGKNAVKFEVFGGKTDLLSDS